MKVIFTNKESELQKMIREFVSSMTNAIVVEIDKMVMEGLGQTNDAVEKQQG